MPHSRKRSWVFLYSISFLCAITPLVLWAIFTKRSFLCGYDARNQHFAVLLCIKAMWRDLFSGQSSFLKFSLGQGQDLLLCMVPHGLLNPLNQLAVFFPTDILPFCYALITLLSIYLCGLFFGLYIRYINFARNTTCITVIGSLLYAFSGFNMRGTLLHPYFAECGMALPLILLAIERIFRERRGLMLTLIAAAILIFNFYLAYMTTVFAVLYTIIRLAALWREKGLPTAAGAGLHTLGAYLLGALLSSVVFVPVVLYFLQNGRLGYTTGYTASLWHYPLSYYKNAFISAFTPLKTADYTLFLNLSPLVFFSALALFIPKFRVSHRTLLRAIVILCLLGAALPAFGKLMNSLSYVTNRWCYAIGFVGALCVVCVLPAFSELKSKQRLFLLLCAAAYAVCIALFGHLTAHEKRLFFLSVLFFAAFGALLFGMRRTSPRTSATLLCAATVLCCAFRFGSYAPLLNPATQNLDALIMHTVTPAAGLTQECTARVDTGECTDNYAFYLGYNGTGVYCSLAPDFITRYYTNVECPLMYTGYLREGLGSSLQLQAIAHVGTALRGTEDKTPTAYGFTETDSSGSAQVYENNYALPLGVLFTETLSEEAYEALSPLDRREALLRYAILPNGSTAAPSSAAQTVPYEIVSSEGLVLKDNTLFAKKTDAELVLRYTQGADTDICLNIEGGRRTSSGWDLITVTAQNGVQHAAQTNAEEAYSYPQRGVLISLGSTENEEVREVTLRFPKGYRMTYDAINMYALPLSFFRDDIAALRERGAFNPTVSNGVLQGSITSGTDAILQIAIPYSDGWRAEVDGVETPIFRCGGMYMGLNLSEGTHEICMIYHTPGLRTGAMLSAAGVVLCLLVFFLGKRKEKHVKQ